MEQFLQTIINGISMGAGYTLIGLGLTVTYSVYRLINLCHGEFYMLGAFATFFAITLLKVNFFVALVIAMIIVGIIGLISERLVFRPLQKLSEADQLVGTIGLFFLIENLALYFLTPNMRAITSPFPPTSVVNLWGLTVSSHRMMIIIITFIMVLVLHFFFSKTKQGKQMRSVAQDKEVAQLMGVDIRLIGKITFFLSCALASMAGTIMGSLQQISPVMGMGPLLIALVVVIFGGLGSNIGAIVGGLIVGIIQSLTVSYLSPAASDVAVYLLLFLTLMIKPTGLFGGKAHA